MTLPTIHLNGTSRKELAEQYLAAYEALGDALPALQAASPNARDYYPAGPDAYTAAAAEHMARLQRIDAMRQELLDLYLHCE